jgi:hypothetical protein
MPLESTIETYLSSRVKAMGGLSLKGAIPGQRFIDRICIMPDGVTLWVECKRPTGGHRTKLQENRIAKLLEMGHFAFFVRTKEEVDLILDGIRVFMDGKLHVKAFPWMVFHPCAVSTPSGLFYARFSDASKI